MHVTTESVIYAAAEQRYVITAHSSQMCIRDSYCTLCVVDARYAPSLTPNMRRSSDERAFGDFQTMIFMLFPPKICANSQAHKE